MKRFESIAILLLAVTLASCNGTATSEPQEAEKSTVETQHVAEAQISPTNSPPKQDPPANPEAQPGESTANTASKTSSGESPEQNSETTPEQNSETTPEQDSETTPEQNSETTPEQNLETTPEQDSKSAPPTETAGSPPPSLIAPQDPSAHPEGDAKPTSLPVAKPVFRSRILSWNVESEGNDPALIAEQLSQLKGYDIVGLTEVHPSNFQRYGKAVGGEYRWSQSKSGFNDRMMLIYSDVKYERIRRFELDDINHLKRYRSPMVTHLKDKATGLEFLVMINHLARGKAEIREQQSQQLVDWARTQTLPIIAIGDYNFDYVFSDKTGNEGFNIFLRDNIFQWVKPTEMIDSNWYDGDADGKDDFPGSLLDFCFAAGPATTWKIECNVIVREGDFPDDKRSSDHRPFEVLIEK